MRIVEIVRDGNECIKLPEWCNCKCITIYFADGEVEPLFVSEEIFFKYGLYDCEEINEDEYMKFDFLFRVECAKRSAISFLFCKKYTSYEVAKKLYKLGHREDVVEAVVLHYKKLEYINDDKYLSVYIDGVVKNKIMSLNVLCSKLSEKGFSREVVVNMAYDRGFDEVEMAQKALVKKTGNQIPSDYKDKLKLMRYLAGKGFGSDIITCVFNEDG